MTSPRIVVADRDPAVLSGVSWLLKERGYDVISVGDIAAMPWGALDVAPDVLVVDLPAPEHDNMIALERVHAERRWGDVPIVMMCGLAAEEVASRASGLVATDIVRKPLRARDLLARVQAQLRVRSALRAARETLQVAEAEVRRARDDAESRRRLVEILQEVTEELAPEEIYTVLARRLGRALATSHCSVILARPGDRTGRVVTAFENPEVRNLEIHLDRYPEVMAALDRGRPVLVEDVRTSPLLAHARDGWSLRGNDVQIRSVLTLPFALDRRPAGVFFLRRCRDELPLTADDAVFADTVLKTAITAIHRAHVIELTRADNARLEALAHTDPLTLVLNRRALLARLVSERERALRYNSPLTLLMIDLDHFKRVNDTFGHPVGDQALCEVAQVLRRAVRSVDVVARYGGEEFAAVLPQTSYEGGAVFAERIREEIEAHIFDFGGQALRLTASLGVASFPAPSVESVDDLIAHADRALYRAKSDGRNCVRI